MPGFGLFGTKKKKQKADATGFTEGQKKAQAAGNNVKALDAKAKRRKKMAEVMAAMK